MLTSMPLPLLSLRSMEPKWIFRIVLFLLGLCTVVAWQYERRQEQARIGAAFDELAARKAMQVHGRVNGYARTLLDLRGLFVADPNVSGDEFRRFLQGVEATRRYPALMHIGYAPRVTAANQAGLERRLRAMGVADVRLAPGALPILYGYPAPGGLLGQHMGQDATASRALARARDANLPQLTAQLALRGDPARQPGFVMVLPLYGYSTAPDGVAGRRAALSGYLFASFRTADLVASTIGADLAQTMRLALFDGPEAVAGRLAYDSGRAAAAADERYRSVQHAEVGGRPWTFVFVALAPFVRAARSMLPALVLAGGVVMSVLGAALAYVGTRRWLAEGTVRYLAFHDELTALPNRASLRAAVVAALGEPGQASRVALLIVELTRFRDINYTLGHLTGDEVLRQASARIAAVVGRAGLLARISNVQFGVLLRDADEAAAVALAQRLMVAMEEPLPAHDSKYEVGARAGIATAAGPEGRPGDPDDLVRHADIALHRARASGAAWVVYDAALDPFKPQRLALLSAFRQAIKDDQLEIYCHPKANLRSGRITGAEALVRWRHPEFGLLTPDQFIALIEPTELIQLLTQRMLECALRQSAAWRSDGIALPLAVNLSTRNLLNPALPELVAGLMNTCGANPSWISLEITESSIMDDPALSLRVLGRLHAMGFELVVDDFGTGYSSLSYLMKLPVSGIKIDQSFTMRMTSDPDAAAIVKAIVELAHALGLKVVAEGAETKEVWDALARLGCDEAQGYYISEPLPADAFRRWLQQRAPSALAAAVTAT